MDIKNKYTEEEVLQLVKWFKEHPFQGELDLGHGIYVRDAEKAIYQFCHLIPTRWDNPNFLGVIHNLIQIQNAIIAQQP